MGRFLSGLPQLFQPVEFSQSHPLVHHPNQARAAAAAFLLFRQEHSKGKVQRSSKRSNFKKSIMIHSANKTLLSPNRNSFLNDEINLTRKLSKIEVTHSRLLNSSPLDPKIVLHNSIKRIHKNNGSFGASQFQSYLN